MGLDATTFILEILNFLVLLWLLQRFVYRPVQAAITKRQQDVEQVRKALDDQRAALAQQRKTLDGEEAARETGREAALQQVQADVSAERARRLAELDREMTAEQARAEARLAARQAQEAGRQEAEAAARADRFLRAYLQRLAGAELEAAVIRLFLADLAALPAGRLAWRQELPADAAADIATTFDTPAALRGQVEDALAACLGRRPGCRWQTDAALLAGISVRIGGHVLEASLAHALDAFGNDGKTTS